MGALPTIKIRNKRNGKTRIINEAEWAHDLGKGKYDGWERAGGERRAAPDEDVVEAAAQRELARKREAEAAKRREEADAATAEAEKQVATEANERQQNTRRGRGRRA